MRKREGKIERAGAASLFRPSSEAVLRRVSLDGLASLLVLGLVVMGLLAEPVRAKEDPGSTFYNGYEFDLDAGDLVAKESSVAITINTAADKATLRAEEGWGTSKAQGIVKQTASVAFGATDGYVIKISGNPTLKGVDSRNSIAGVTSSTTLAQMQNQWGWYSVDGDVECDAAKTFHGMTITGEEVASGALSTAGTKTLTMCFGAKVDGTQAGDTYSNTITVSAVAQPSMSRTAFSGIKTLQEMTPAICSAATGDITNGAQTAYLEDERDGKYYWVTKLADGNCWMSQNLALNLSTNTPLTADTSATAWTPTQNTIQDTPTGGTHANTGTYSWNLGEYVLNTPTATTACTSNSAGLDACSAQGFVKVAASEGWVASRDPNFYRATMYIGKNGETCSKSENSAVNASASADCKFYDTHYLVGNYYQWNAATAGTGGTISNTNATGSICPKGWELPKSSMAYNDASGSFYNLLNKYGVSNSVQGSVQHGYNDGGLGIYYYYNITLSPLFFPRVGNIRSGGSSYLESAGASGMYWSSRAYSDESKAYYLAFSTEGLYPSEDYNSTRSIGRSVRCLFPAS